MSALALKELGKQRTKGFIFRIEKGENLARESNFGQDTEGKVLLAESTQENCLMVLGTWKSRHYSCDKNMKMQENSLRVQK